ncbi:MAG: hypothetical protein KI793_28985 [Rivularia sp. (in: Bacteria)]|nr:hypothetical protein [Rivularia sp. MS3]
MIQKVNNIESKMLMPLKGKVSFQNNLPLSINCYIKYEAIKLPWQIK